MEGINKKYAFKCNQRTPQVRRGGKKQPKTWNDRKTLPCDIILIAYASLPNKKKKSCL